MTKQQLLKFIKTRNSSDYSSNLQFQIDAEYCGFKVRDLGKPEQRNINGIGVWTWNTPFGCLVEVGRSIDLYDSWESFLATTK